MKKDIQEHFAKFYRRFLFLNQNIGKEEQVYEDCSYQNEVFEDGKIGIYMVYEQRLKDSSVLFKVPGIILNLSYGEFYNRKHGEMDVYLYPDVDYVGEPAKIKDALKLLDDFLDNNYKEYNEKINRAIYGNDGRKIKKLNIAKKIF